MLKSILKIVGTAAVIGAGSLSHAQTTPAPAAAAAPSSPAKKELVAKVLSLQQGGVEQMARVLAEQPARLMIQQAGAALQRLPADKRESVARDIEGDVRKYVEDATPVVTKRAIAVAPSTIGALLEERFTEDELRQIVALLESPVNRKFQSMAPEMQKVLAERLVTDTRGEIEPMMRYLELQVSRRLAAAAPNGAASGAAAKSPAKSAASVPKGK